jgi:signal transduction histidine kinase
MSARGLHGGFDAELALGDLFDAAELAQWETWLTAWARREVRIVSPGVHASLQHHALQDHAWVMYHELEPLLALVTHTQTSLPPALTAAFEAHVRERIRYRLASTLQIDTSSRDWEALQASEARFCALASELELRVQAQVADLERARVYAFQAEHQRAVAQLAAGMAHEINNPIGFIAANLRSAQAYLAELRQGGLGAAADTALLEDFEALLEESAEGAARVASIVAQLRVFSQVDATAVASVQPRALVEAAVALLAREVPESVRVCIDGDPSPWSCEAAAVSQAAFQLLRNALQAMAGRAGAVHLRLQERAGERVLEVEDTGCGMSADVLDRACDPFYSSREVGQGVGLGLSVVSEVARRHGGRLELFSRPGEGTRAVLHLGAEAGSAA